ncbi:hypothetical protein HUJ04_000682 [Dendroctonus ponderosae]
MSSGYLFPSAKDLANPKPLIGSYGNIELKSFVQQQYPVSYHPVNEYDQPSSDPYYEDKIADNVGDFSPFYIAITFCTIIAFALFVLNIALGCCSRYSEYWNDRHTGNRWIVSLWTATPHKQPALDYSTELQEISSQNQVVYHHPREEEAREEAEFLELRTKRESEI